MEGMRFTQNRQNTRSFGKILAGNPTPKYVRRYSSSQVTSDSVSRSEDPDLGRRFGTRENKRFYYMAGYPSRQDGLILPARDCPLWSSEQKIAWSRLTLFVNITK